MSDPGESFGASALAAAGTGALLELEERAGKTELFAEVDSLSGELLNRGICGQELLRRDGDASVTIPDLSPELRELLNQHFALESQHHKGAWYLPEQVTVKMGVQNLAWHFATYPRFAAGIVQRERARVAPATSAAAILSWAVTEPLFEQLYVPFDLRGRSAGTKSAEEQLAAWADFDALVEGLGLDVEGPIAVMRYGGGWGALRADAQLAAKQALLGALASQATPRLAARYRAQRLGPLIAQYYAKAKGGVAKRRQVITRAFQKDLSAFFGGDWLAFVRYLGEQPHPDEQIESALPEVKLMVAGTKSAQSVAESLGLPASEVERALATYWGPEHRHRAAQLSPIEERVAILSEFWQSFDEIHAAQAPGMPTLQGFYEVAYSGVTGWQAPDWRAQDRQRRTLPGELCLRIETAWGTVMLPRWPERIVTNPAPYGFMVAALGPAFTFWHGVGVSAWNMCEGHSATGEMSEMAEYHSSELAQLAELGCPIPASVFDELTRAQERLGKPEEIFNETSSGKIGFIKYTLGGTTTKRSGYEGLRDVITAARRAWADAHLETYLRARWDSEIREAARLYFQALADRQKPPTPKQFARNAAVATNHWLGGDLSAFYGVIGEKSSLDPIRASLMPKNPRAFSQAVYKALGGRPPSREQVAVGDTEGQAQRAHEQTIRDELNWLASQSLHAIQLEEALERPPSITEFGRQSFEFRSGVLAEDPAEAWERYLAAIAAVRLGPEPDSEGLDESDSDPSESDLAQDSGSAAGDVVDAAAAAPEGSATPVPLPPSAGPLPPQVAPQTSRAAAEQPVGQPLPAPPAKRKRWFGRDRTES